MFGERADDRLDRWVALKIPHATRMMSETTAARFKTEARAAAAISHPNVVQVYEVLMEDGLPILIQQWIDGPSLADSLKQSGPMNYDRAADWMIQIADAVACAHEHGIVHRDIKPANVMLNKGRPMVLDFGLASYPQFSSGLTTEGTMLGTPAYMSPEQASGLESASEPTSDIYSLGAMLYEMLVGHPPFVGKTNDVLRSVKSNMPTPPRALRRSVPRDLQTIALRCLAKSPTSRYGSAADLRDDLKRFRDRKPIRARKVGLFERSVVWCKANPVSTILWITFPVLIALSGTVARSMLEQYELTDRADHLAEQQVTQEKKWQALVEKSHALRLARASMELSGGDRTRGLQLLDGVPNSARGWEWQLLKKLTSSPSIALPIHSDGNDVHPISTRPPITNLAVDHKSRLYGATIAGMIYRWKMGGKSNPDQEQLEFPDPTVASIYSGPAPIRAMATSSDGMRLAWGDDRGTIVVWDTNSDKATFRRECPRKGAVTALAFSPDGKTLAAGTNAPRSTQHGGRGSFVRSFRVDDQGKLEEIDEVGTPARVAVSSICFVSNDRLLITRGGRTLSSEAEGFLEEWTTDQKHLARTKALWRGFNARGLDYHPKLNCVSWCDSLGVFYVFDVASGQIACRKISGFESLLQTRFSKNGEKLFCTANDSVTCWSIEPSKAPKPTAKSGGDSQPPPKQFVAIHQETYRGHESATTDVALLPVIVKGTSDKAKPRTNHLVSAGDDGRPRLWLTASRQDVVRTNFHKRRVSDAHWMDSERIAFATFAPAARKDVSRRSHVQNGGALKLDETHLGMPVAVSGQGERSVICCRDKIVAFDAHADAPRFAVPIEPNHERFTAGHTLESLDCIGRIRARNRRECGKCSSALRHAPNVLS